MNRPHLLLVVFAVAALALPVVGCTGGSAEPRRPAAITLALTLPGAVNPTVAFDGSNRTTLVAYTRKSGEETDVYVARWMAGHDVFEAPVRVNDRAGDAASHRQAPAQVAIAPDGTVLVAWLAQTPVDGRRFPASDVRIARSTDGGRTFEPAVTVNEDAGIPTSHHFHNLAVGPDGTVYVSWLDGSARDASTREDAGAHDSHGDGHGHAGDSGIEVRVARSVDGGRSFEPSVRIAVDSCQCCRTSLAVGRSGVVYVAWRHVFDGSIRDIAIARSDDRGRTFSRPVRLHEDGWQIGGCPHSGPAIAVDDRGVLHAVWYTGASGRTGVYYASTSDDELHFGSATPLVTGVPIAQVGAASAGPGNGAWIAWEDPMNDQLHVMHARSPDLDPASADTLLGEAPSLTRHPAGAITVWSEGENLVVRIPS